MFFPLTFGLQGRPPAPGAGAAIPRSRRHGPPQPGWDSHRGFEERKGDFMQINKLDDAVREVAEVFQFEQWMRFYFLKEEEGDKLRLEVPEEMVRRVEEKTPHLKELLDEMNHDLVDYETSQKAVCSFVGTHIEGVKHSPYLVPKVFDSKDFKLEMYLFNLWLKAFEERFDIEPDKGFDEWQELYAEWRETDEVKKYIQELDSAATPSMGEPANTTIQ
jgi:hypothetical protein